MADTPSPSLGTMTPEEFQRIRQVFDAALERAPGERRRYVELVCAGDTALMTQVERMLRAEDQRHTLLDGHDSPGVPAVGATSCSSCGATVAASHRFCPACGTPLTGATQDEGRFRAGALFADRFRIVSMLGRGGMGEVYRAARLSVAPPPIRDPS